MKVDLNKEEIFGNTERRPSTVEERQNLLTRYKDDINQTEIDYYDNSKKTPANETDNPQSYTIQ